MRKDSKTLEIAMRIHRYLNMNAEHPRPFLVEGMELPWYLQEQAEQEHEAAFEECIARLYENRPRYRRGLSLLMQKSWILDRLFGSHDERIYRYTFRHYDDRAEICRKDYHNYLKRDFHYETSNGQPYFIQRSKYNEYMLETLLPEEQWQALQIYKHGTDHVPAENFEKVKYHRQWEDIPQPPPSLLEWWKEVGEVSNRGAFSVG